MSVPFRAHLEAEGSGVAEERLEALEEKLDSREDIITQLLENGKKRKKKSNCSDRS